jgi:hypothetical protein
VTLPELHLAVTVACEQCGGPAELESDGESEQFECTDQENCGAVFGYRLLRQDQGGVCGLGVPTALQQAAPPGQVFLGTIGRRPE